MGFLKGLFGKKEGSCCNVKIEEVKEKKDSCCSKEGSEKIEEEQKNDSCCK